jgi:hypothetical protein
MKIKESDVKKYFTDGRKVSFILERRIAYEFLKGKLAETEGDEYDILAPNGDKWEVRSITAGGVYFCPSYMVGKGRKFELNGFLKKLKVIKGYILADVLKFPDVPFWIIPKEIVETWWEHGDLGINSSISHKKALALINDLQKEEKQLKL